MKLIHRLFEHSLHIQLPAVHRSRRGGEAEVALDEGAVVAAGAAQGDERLREVVPVQPCVGRSF